MKKYNKEEELKQEAIETQARMQFELEHKRREKDNYEKNYMRAEEEAKKIMM